MENTGTVSGQQPLLRAETLPMQLRACKHGYQRARVLRTDEELENLPGAVVRCYSGGQSDRVTIGAVVALAVLNRVSTRGA